MYGFLILFANSACVYVSPVLQEIIGKKEKENEIRTKI